MEQWVICTLWRKAAHGRTFPLTSRAGISDALWGCIAAKVKKEPCEGGTFAWFFFYGAPFRKGIGRGKALSGDFLRNVVFHLQHGTVRHGGMVPGEEAQEISAHIIVVILVEAQADLRAAG